MSERLESINVICPKCGYEQDDRIDCLKCGVVFSKYYALYPKGKPAPAETAETAHDHGVPSHDTHVQDPHEPAWHSPSDPAPRSRNTEDQDPNELVQLRRQMKELNRRFTELELERAQQVRLRGEVSFLEQRMLGSLKEIQGHLIDLQHRVEEPPPPPLVSEELPSLRSEVHREFAAIQKKIADLNLAPIAERLDRLESRGEEARQKEGSKDSLELENLKSELDALRNSLQNVTIRYSEIGELKKNHLALSHSVEAVQQELAGGGEGASKKAEQKIAHLEKEVIALRAESRQLLKQVETSGASGSSHQDDLLNIKEEMLALVESRSGLEQQLRALEDRISAGEAEELGRIKPEVLAQIQQMEARFSAIESKIPPPSAPGSKNRTTDPLLELGNVLKELDGLRSSLQNVTFRYSEIGELKKNYLLLSNSIENMRRNFEALGEGGVAEVSRQLKDLEAENTALSGEIRGLAKQLETSEASISARIGELEGRVADNRVDPKVLEKVETMDGRFEEVETKLSALSQEQRNSTNDVMQEHAKVLQDLDGLRASLQNAATQYSEIAELKKTQDTLTGKLEELAARASELAAQPPAEPVPPLETDVHAIRENLEDIRRFMSSLSQKL